jgi:hypothetical protein
LLNTLDALSRIDPIVFSSWQVMDYPAIDSLPLAMARPRIAAIIDNNVSRDDFGKPEPDEGYRAGAYTGHGLSPRRMSLRINAGGTGAGETDLEAGEHDMFPDPAIVTYPVFKAALLAMNAIWPPVWACAYAFRSDFVKVPESYGGGVQGYRLESLPRVPSHPTFRYSPFHITWLAYLSVPLAAGLEMPPEIQTERTPDGGLLMIATEQRLDPTDPEHLRRARILARTMIARTGYRSARNSAAT